MYPRWGSRSCPVGAITLYDGFMAGGHYTHYGGGANLLCMHGVPQYPEGYSDANNNGNLLYGVEYENTGNQMLSHIGSTDAACVLCQRGEASQVYTQWGRTSCAHGHHTEYSGLVMASYYAHTRQQNLCVDPSRQPHRTSSFSDHNGATLYLTEMEQGSSDEISYPHNRELACAVCSTRDESVHVRWGSRSCTDGARLLSDGFIASSHHSHRGGGANALCMHSSPQYPVGYNDGDQNGNLLYGTEYKSTSGPLDANVDGDAACALCARSRAAPTYIQWGRSTCSHGHTLEYTGIVMGDFHLGNPGEHLCMATERAVHSASVSSSGNGGRLYTTEIRGGFDSAVYPTNREISCVACTPSLGDGAVYTRWGSRTCPSSARLVYEGFMAGGGGGFNYVCLHNDPQHPAGFSDASEPGDGLYGVQCARRDGIEPSDCHARR